MKLSPHFTLEEMIFSQYAVRHGIDNNPSIEQIENLRALCINLLEPLRELVSRPITVTSGYRSPLVNRGIGGSATSQHMEGRAADIIVQGLTIQELYERIRDSQLPYDQLIQEFDSWVHVSYAPRLRRQALYAVRENDRTVYVPDVKWT
jgi:zinc D-Ala-D-Ala carboxypeptidase